jgi:hypothetical protein
LGLDRRRINLVAATIIAYRSIEVILEEVGDASKLLAILLQDRICKRK